MTSPLTSSISDLEKAPTGIEGFDELTGGGLPRGRTTVIIGAPGCGKTTFALQSLVNGIRQWNEPAIFVAFEENSRQLTQNTKSFGWDLEGLQPGKLFLLNARIPPDMVKTGDFDLNGLLDSLKAKADEIGARRIVFDSLDVMLHLLDNPVVERQEAYRIHDWLETTQLTGIITLRNEGDSTFTSDRYGFIQFMADCSVLLRHYVHDQVSLRAVRILKYRGSGFLENEMPLTIGPEGMEVVAPVALAHPDTIYTERISTGVERLDTMLQGGYYRGSSVLITGSPGTSKSTLVSAFSDAACRRGERTLYISFDEDTGEIVRNMRSVGMDLDVYIQSGMLQLKSLQTEMYSADENLMVIKRLIRTHKPSCVVIDPLSAMLKAGGLLTAFGVAQRLIRQMKDAGITFVCTSLLETPNPQLEATPLQISTISDTWIHVSYLVQSGERNRALTIVKSRGTNHSNQVRELILSETGLTLTDVYTAGGEVLMGTLRYEKEMAKQIEHAQAEADITLRRQELEHANLETKARIEELQHELEMKRVTFRELERLMGLQKEQWQSNNSELRRRRGADENENGADERH